MKYKEQLCVLLLNGYARLTAKKYLEVHRTEGFADLIIDPMSKKSLQIGVEMAEHMIHFDTLHDKT